MKHGAGGPNRSFSLVSLLLKKGSFGLSLLAQCWCLSNLHMCSNLAGEALLCASTDSAGSGPTIRKTPPGTPLQPGIERRACSAEIASVLPPLPRPNSNYLGHTFKFLRTISIPNSHGSYGIKVGGLVCRHTTPHCMEFLGGIFFFLQLWGVGVVKIVFTLHLLQSSSDTALC